MQWILDGYSCENVVLNVTKYLIESFCHILKYNGTNILVVYRNIFFVFYCTCSDQFSFIFIDIVTKQHNRNLDVNKSRSLMNKPWEIVVRTNSLRHHDDVTLQGTRLGREPILIWVKVHLRSTALKMSISDAFYLLS